MSKLRNIQSLRAIAAMLVVADHALTFTVGHGAAAEPLTSIAWFLGEQGVAVFFVISGFIMAYTTHDQFGVSGSTIRFWDRRIARVVPLYWLGTGLAAVLIATGIWHRPFQVTFERLWNSLLFVPYSDGSGPMRPLLGPGWTLNYEMIFYAIFGAGLMWPARFGKAFILATLALMVTSGAALFPIWGGADPSGYWAFVTSPIIILFAAGAGVGWACSSGVRLPVSGSIQIAALCVAASVATFVVALCRYPVPLVWQLAFWPLDILAVAVCALGRSEAYRPLEAVGEASYSLYLSHFFVLLVAAKAWSAAHFVGGPALFVPLAMAATVPVAMVLYQWVEKRATWQAIRPLLVGRAKGIEDAAA